MQDVQLSAEPLTSLAIRGINTANKQVLGIPEIPPMETDHTAYYFFQVKKSSSEAVADQKFSLMLSFV